MFQSLATGHPYHASLTQQDYIRRAGWCLVSCPKYNAGPGVACKDVERGRGKAYVIPVQDARRELASEQHLGSIGWHTFSHSHRSLLSGADTAMDVQQKLMRHAHITTTQLYGAPHGEPAPGEQRGRSGYFAAQVEPIAPPQKKAEPGASAPGSRWTRNGLADL